MTTARLKKRLQQKIDIITDDELLADLDKFVSLSISSRKEKKSRLSDADWKEVERRSKEYESSKVKYLTQTHLEKELNTIKRKNAKKAAV